MGSEPLTIRFELVDCQIQVREVLRLQMLLLNYQRRRFWLHHMLLQCMEVWDVWTRPEGNSREDQRA
jgi:hypothetical protein